jgi:hypothetical protein
MSEKFPRIFHLPFSPGSTQDDKRHPAVPGLFVGMPLIVTEKVDGSNVCLERAQVFARSHEGAPRHPSFDALKALHAGVCYRIPDPLQIFGEWTWATHSIHYTALPHYLLLFGIRDTERNLWLTFDAVQEWAQTLGCAAVPFLEAFTAESDIHLRSVIERHANAPSDLGGEREGVVLRWSREFTNEEFAQATAKWVRPDHVQTNDHWSRQQIVCNQLRQTM